jgi:DsbC/DsbD-like thiol-disulfide interchange protein
MMIGINRMRLAIAVFALLVGIGGAFAADDFSRWDGDARSSVRLIAASRPTAEGAALHAGIEIKLKTGWHTYWRYPGDAGVPPQFDFTRSENLKQVDVLWPAPQRVDEGGGTSIGYARDIILPLRVVAQNRAKSVTLRLKLNYAICEKLCVPAEAAPELVLPVKTSSQDAVLAAAEARVPKKVAPGESRTLTVRSVHQEAGAVRPQIVVDLAAPPGAEVELFAEGPTPAWALPVPSEVGSSAPGLRRFVFELDGAPPGESYKGAQILLTAVTATDAIEVSIRLD